MAYQEVSSSEMTGIAKKMNGDLEGLPLHTHLAIVEMVKVLADHRNLTMKVAFQKSQQEQQERALSQQREALDRQAQAADEAAIAKLGPLPT